MTRLTRALALALATALALLALPAAPSSAASITWGTLVFNKNPSDPSNSTLIFQIKRDDGVNVRTLVSKSFRAGSGMGSTDTCYRNNGWLPNGTYGMKMYTDYADYGGTLIKGYAFYLDDKKCNTGTTVRSALFIHTESGANNVQCADASGDQGCRWEYPTYNDYLSNGCIKLAPADIKYIHDQVRFYFGTSGGGGVVPFKLSVVS